jgi:outer membrane immunogenic protein
MKKTILALAGAVALLSSSALADGMAGNRTAASAPSWTGLYVGAGIGAGAVVHDISLFGGAFSLDGIGGEGAFGTVIIGYDRQLTSNIVAGIFVDYDFSNISTGLSFGPFSASLDHKNSWSVGARLGMLTSPTTLWYGTAGYTQADFEIDTNFFGTIDLPEFKGYFVGGGVESQLRGGWGLRAEYRFTQFDDQDFGIPFLNVETSMHTARLALTYKWGREEAVHAPMK